MSACAKNRSDDRCLSRIFRRTPSLRTRVALATAIGAAIVVVIVGTVVWVGITNDRKERLDRRLDEAAGFAIPFLPRGLDEIPTSPNDQDAVITVRPANGEETSNSKVVLPQLEPGYADTYVGGVRYRVRTVEIRVPEPMTVAVGATYDATIADTNNLHRRVLIICVISVGAATVLGWLLAAFAVRPLKRLAQQTRQIDAGDEAPDVEVRGATEAVEIADAVNGMLQRIWKEQDRTKAALTSARDFASVSAHELRTPLTAMRTNLEVLATLELAEDQRKEVVNDVIRTQTRIEATLGALERLAQGELSTADDHVPVDITELLDRAAHDAMRVYPDLEVSLMPGADGDHSRTARGPAPGGRQRHRQRGEARRRHPRAAVGGQLPRRGRDRDRRRRRRRARGGAHGGVRAVLAGVHGVALGLGPRPRAGRPAGRITRRHSIFGRQPAGRGAAAAAPPRPALTLAGTAVRASRPFASARPAWNAVPAQGLAGVQQVDDEDQRLAGQPVPATGWTVGLLRRDGQLAAAADLHAGDAVLPALDQAAQRELDGLAAVPGTVELLAGVVLDADVVHLDVAAGHGLSTVADHHVVDDQLGGRRAVGEFDLGFL